MVSSDTTGRDTPPPYELRQPARQSVPFIYASPHSGATYPPGFVAAAALDPMALRRSEDAFVDRLFGAAPGLGAPLLAATYPRVYVDLNREPYELDPEMFAEALPEFVNTNSARVSVGLGTIARVVANGAAIYTGPITFADVRTRKAVALKETDAPALIGQQRRRRATGGTAANDDDVRRVS